MIQVAGLRVGYGDTPVLHEIGLTVPPSGILSLLGRNGSGKSTLLRAIAGLLKPTGGSVRVDGLDVLKSKPYQVARKLALVPQQELFSFEFTVREVVAMGRIAAGTGLFETTEDRERVEQAIQEADLAALADRSILALSGGERQRVLMARALAQDAQVLLLDEPTAHLDLEHQAGFIRTVRGLQEKGMTIVAALHDLALAAALGGEAMLIDQGRTVLTAPVEVLLRDPALEQTFRVPFSREVDAQGVLRVYPQIAP